MNRIISLDGANPGPNDFGAKTSIFAIGAFGITDIVQRTEDCGTYHIKWYDIYRGTDLYCSMNALHVSRVTYA